MLTAGWLTGTGDAATMGAAVAEVLVEVLVDAPLAPVDEWTVVTEKETAAALLAEPPPAPAHPLHSLFDGRSFTEWEGDPKLWRVENGLIIGGSLKETVTHNDFLASNARYTNFVLRLKFKLTGTGFVNSGVQIRSEREPNGPEMIGYQCDLGDPNWWGSLYDESRRKKTLVAVDMEKVKAVLHRDDWNEYRVRAEGPHIQIWLNGLLTVDYTEDDPKIARDGLIALQIHGGGKTRVEFKDLQLERLNAAK